MSEISAYRDGVQFERERIIKLLEREREWLMSTGDKENIRDAEGVFVAIELLRGENK